MKFESHLRVSVLITILMNGALVALSSGSKIGDIAQGAIVSEDEKVLVLESDPCDPNSPKITFTSPWKKRRLGKKTCSGQSSYDIFQIEQLGAEAEGRKGDEQKSPKDTAPKPSPDGTRQKPPNDQEVR